MISIFSPRHPVTRSPRHPITLPPFPKKNRHNELKGLTLSKILVSYYINTQKNHKLVNPCLYLSILYFRSEEIKHRVV